MKRNNYLLDKTLRRLHIELVLPSYGAMHGEYYDLSVSLSLRKHEVFSLYVGLLVGWLRITMYKKEPDLTQ